MDVRYLVAPFLLAACASAQTPPLSLGSVQAMPPRALAERLIGRAAARSIVEAEMDPPIVQGGLPSSVRLIERGRPHGNDLCVQRVHHVTPVAEGQVVTAGGRVTQRIALAPRCRTVAAQRFASVNPGVGLDLAAALLRNVASARTAAAGTGALPFRLTCRDELQQGACRGDGRAALAALPLHQAFLISAPAQIAVGAPSRPLWDVAFLAPGTPHAELLMTWKVPAPF